MRTYFRTFRIRSLRVSGFFGPLARRLFGWRVDRPAVAFVGRPEPGRGVLALTWVGSRGSGVESSVRSGTRVRRHHLKTTSGPPSAPGSAARQRVRTDD